MVPNNSGQSQLVIPKERRHISLKPLHDDTCNIGYEKFLKTYGLLTRKSFEPFCMELRIKHRRTSPYCQQTDCLVERTNSLRMYSNNSQTDWDVYLS